MYCPAELVNRADAGERVAVGAEILQVTGKGGAVAAYVNDAFGLHFYHGFQKGFVAAFARRIDNDDICVDAVLFVFAGKNFLGFSCEKFHISDIVYAGVFIGIFDSLRNDFHTSNKFRLLRKEKRNRPDSAVQIPYSFVTVEICVFQSLCVKLLRLFRIDLIE